MNLKKHIFFGLFISSFSVFAEQAIHINNFGCGMLDGHANFILADRSSVVITSSANGNLKCQKEGVVNHSGRAIIFNYENTGLLCGTINGTTKNWQETLSASGRATLTCHTRL